MKYAKEIMLDALLGGGGLTTMFLNIELGVKILVGLGTIVLLYFRIKNAIKEGK